MEHLEKTINDLVKSKKEGNYWDFKEIPHDNKADLLHDILCLANANHHGDRYLIFGVSDPSTGAQIVGINSNSQNRKNQQQLIDFLSTKPFVGSVRPEVSLNTIILENKEIDVITIANKRLKPYSLTTNYLEGKKTILANNIYTRVGDTNTPKDSSADPLDVEKMWREKLNLDMPPMEMMLSLMESPNNWQMDLGNSNDAYHKIHPEYKIEFTTLQRFDSNEAYCFYYPNPQAYLGVAKFIYHSTILFEKEYMTCDEMRVHLPVPETEFICQNDFEGWFYYYIQDETSGIFLKFLTKGTMSFSSGRGSEAPFLIFKNKMSLFKFVHNVNQNIDEIISIPPSVPAQFAKKEKDNENNQMPVDPIFLDQIHQFYEKIYAQ